MRYGDLLPPVPQPRSSGAWRRRTAGLIRLQRVPLPQHSQVRAGNRNPCGRIYVSIYEGVRAVDDAFPGSATVGSQVSGFISNRGATTEAGEIILNGTASVWRSWTAPANGNAIVSLLGSDFDTVLEVFTGSSFAALTPVTSPQDDFDTGLTTSAVSFPAVSGTVYRIRMAGFGGSTGTRSRATLIRAPTTILCSCAVPHRRG